MIFDAIHHVMEIDSALVGDKGLFIIKQLMDSPHFQRLKGIKQLGLTDMVFPTATHTRFSHSTGTAYLASKIIKQLKANFESHTTPLNIIIAALLHDIGHGPFSHSFEEFFTTYLGQELKHEAWSCAFIDYLSSEGSLPSSMHHEIIDLLFRKEGRSFCHDIISSGLDCDRLDYLLRDSHFCGVSYGTFDLDWLLHTLTIVKTEEGKSKLGISAKGLGAIENYLINRRLLYLNIYQNRNILGFCDQLICFLVALATWVGENGDLTEKKNLIGFYLFEFLETINRCQAKKTKPDETIKIAFDKYKFLTDMDIWAAIRNLYFSTISLIPPPLKEIARSFMERRSPKVREIRPTEEKTIQNFIKSKGWEREKYKINIIKPNFLFYDPNHADIYIQYDRVTYKIQEKSQIIAKLLDLRENRWFLKLDPQIYHEVREELTPLGVFT